MQRVAMFERVSFKQFSEDYAKILGLSLGDAKVVKEAREAYDNVKLPERATSDSAGYDFFFPLEDLEIEKGESKLIPTGIRVRMETGWVLQIFPRSGLGFKYFAQLANTVGIIDGDYYNSENEGHIFIKVKNSSTEENAKTVPLVQGAGFAQGIFIPYGLTYNDEESGVRNGGFGSTTK